ncbi:hypothetical protein J2S60_001005 [Gleimia europaea]|nr:hypothetical protein [Gleimia europaea]
MKATMLARPAMNFRDATLESNRLESLFKRRGVKEKD